eukprot:608904-Hanusia_phi.AAC.4
MVSTDLRTAVLPVSALGRRFALAAASPRKEERDAGADGAKALAPAMAQEKSATRASSMAADVNGLLEA